METIETFIKWVCSLPIFAGIGFILGFGLFSLLWGIYRFCQFKIGSDPFQAIVDFLRKRELVEQQVTRLEKRSSNLENRENDLKGRSEFLDKKYEALQKSKAELDQQFDYYQQLTESEEDLWQRLRSKTEANFNKGQAPLLELVKRDAATRARSKGLYRFLYDHRNNLNDTTERTVNDLFELLLKEFQDSSLKTFVMNDYELHCHFGYNPYLIAWILMITLHNTQY